MSDVRQCALIFVNWRTPDLTLRAVQSARATVADSAGLRILVIDNGSGDGSAERLAQALPDADVVALPENVGFARAANAGLQRVHAPYAFILNSDIEFRDRAIETLAQALAADDKAAMACPKLLRPDGSIQPAPVPQPRVFWEIVSRNLHRHLHYHFLKHDRTRVVPGVVGPCMALKMSALQKVGLFDEQFFFFFEETDLCKRIREAGWNILYVPAAEVLHLQGESANRRPVRARIQFHISRYRYFGKHAGPLGVGILFLGLWLRATLNLLGSLLLLVLTLGKRKHRDRLAMYSTIWVWHLLVCRPKWGFES